MADEQPRPEGEQPAAKAKPRRRGPSWRDDLIRTKSGPRDCVANVVIVLEGEPIFADAIRYDLMRNCVVALGLPWQDTLGRWREWTDRDDIALARWLQLHGIPAKPRTVAEGVQDFAMSHAIDPLRDRLEALSWDGTERLSMWLMDYLGVEDSGYARAVGRAWMIGAVARVFRPGCKVDHVLILEGQQGVGKSQACSTLALMPEWFADDIRDLGTKDSAQDLRGKWIIEIAELSAMRRSDIERVKAFVSRGTDHYRPSYGTRSQDYPRRCAFVGSNNADEYLNDATGARRFWPVAVAVADDIALADLRRDVGQLWAEAVAAYRGGEHWWLDAEMEREAAAEQADRRISDPWEAKVMAYVREEHGRIGGVVTVTGTLLAVGIDLAKQDRAAHTRVGSILAANKWVRRQKRDGHGRTRFYTPPEDTPA